MWTKVRTCYTAAQNICSALLAILNPDRVSEFEESWKMGAAGDASADLGLQENSEKGRITPYVLFTCMMAASGGLMYGYDIIIAGGVSSMNDFLREFYPSVLAKKENSKFNTYCKYDNQVLQLFSSSLYLAALVSTFFASHVTRRWGRKTSMLTAGLLFDAGTIIGTSAQNVAMLITGRVFLGLGLGFANQAIPVFLSEMAPQNWRGGLNLLFSLNTTSGVLLAGLVNYGAAKIHPSGWKLSLGMAGIPGILLTIAGVVVVETPNSLIERGDVESAKAVLRKIRGTDRIENELATIIKASQVAQEIKSPFKTLLKRRNRPHLVTAIAVPLFQQMAGNDGILFYGPILFQTIGFKEDASLYNTVILGAIKMISSCITIFTIDRLGRRFQLLVASVLLFIVQVIIAIIIATYMQPNGHLPEAAAISVLAMICLFGLAFGCSWGPLTWLIPSEIFALETRSAGQSVGVCSNVLFKFVIAQSFLSMLCGMKYGIFLFFAGWIVIMWLFVIFLLPETKGVGIEEVNLLWEKHWFWQRFACDPDEIQDSVTEMKAVVVVGEGDEGRVLPGSG